MRTSIKIYVAKLLYYILIFFRIKKDNLVSRKSIKWHLDISEGIDLSIFLFGSFQGSVVQSIINFILKKKLKRKSKFTIIDVGSNIGDKSLSLAKNLLDLSQIEYEKKIDKVHSYWFDKRYNESDNIIRDTIKENF